MEWICCCLIVIQCLSTQAYHDLVLNRVIDIIQRRHHLDSDSTILGVPDRPEDLPEAEPILPGHTLIRPVKGMLKSAAKYPQQDLNNNVYGNLANLGITYGKSGFRTVYTGFRKTNDLLTHLLQGVNKEKRKPSIIIIELDNVRPRLQKLPDSYLVDPDQGKYIEEENDASEILDKDLSDEKYSGPEYRRKGGRSKSKFRNREELYSGSSAATESSESSDNEKNPGNPYTVHKNKYLQNWLWNHYMDGDHMNVNPFAPKPYNGEPSGAELFFGRKWWYFNQDDYKPMA